MSVDNDQPKTDGEEGHSDDHHEITPIQCPCKATLIARWFGHAISDKHNLPHFLIFAATLLLAIFAYTAWQEAKQGTAALRDQLETLRRQYDLTTRAVLVSDIKGWKIFPDPPNAGDSTTISFSLKNVGHTHAFILRTSYEYTVASAAPSRFAVANSIPDYPALLNPEIEYPIIISNLPQLSQSDFQAINSGASYLWLRTIFRYRDDNATLFEIRFTGRYGRAANERGERILGFAFPDIDVPAAHETDLYGLRCLNVVNPSGCPPSTDAAAKQDAIKQ